MKYIGVNSGTSVDAIDVAIVDISSVPYDEHCATHAQDHADDFRYTVKLLHFESFPWDAQDRDLLFKIINSETNRDISVRDVCLANALVGKRMGECVSRAINGYYGAKEKGVMVTEVSDEEEFLIGCHGQSVWHEPERPSNARYTRSQWTPSTLQIGEMSIVSEMTGCAVVSDFRQQDLHAGGQGAPLTSILDACLMRPPSNIDDAGVIEIRALQNLGGIGNVTLLGSNSTKHLTKEISFDTGPANALIDDCVRLLTNGKQSFDGDGEMAAAGTVCEELLEEMLSLKYFDARPPKTTGRELFNAALAQTWIERAQSEFGLSDESIVSTITELTVKSIVSSYEQVLHESTDLLLNGKIAELRLGDCICAGGGIKNKELMRRLTRQLQERFGKHVNVLTQDEHARMNSGFSSESKEAVLFAFLAYLHEQKRTGNIESCTGATRGRRILGKTTPKQNVE